MFQALKRLLTSAETTRPSDAGRRPIRARWDAAQTTDENARHWANADFLSADAAASPQVRATLRSRARYEAQNNCYARGLVDTIANTVVGRGPTLHVLSDDAQANTDVETAWRKWATAVDLPRKLRMMRAALCESGEVFAILTTNPRLPLDVQLDIRLIEADQVAQPTANRLTDPLNVDGIEVDEDGNPMIYHVLKSHPGDRLRVHLPTEADALPANQVLHLANVDRPGQIRGIPQLTPALPLFALMRRYGLAVVSAAENAASIGGIVHTDAAPEDGPEAVEPMDEFEMDRNTWLTMPAGWKTSQFRAEQPTTAHESFTNSIIQEIARCLNVPFIIAAGTAKGANFASGKLDHAAFHKQTEVDRADIERHVLDRIFAAWLAEAALIEGFLPQAFRSLDLPEHEWMWAGEEPIDPGKTATANEKGLANNTTTLAEIYARKGQNWEREIRQRAREHELMHQLGIRSMSSTDEPAEDRDDDSNPDRQTATEGDSNV